MRGYGSRGRRHVPAAIAWSRPGSGRRRRLELFQAFCRAGKGCVGKTRSSENNHRKPAEPGQLLAWSYSRQKNQMFARKLPIPSTLAPPSYYIVHCSYEAGGGIGHTAVHEHHSDQDPGDGARFQPGHHPSGCHQAGIRSRRDQAEVAQLLSAGCLHMRKSFDIEQLNLDDLIATAMDDKGALGDEIKVLKGLSIEDLHTTYRQFCKNEKVEKSPVDLADVIGFYNTALKDLPDARQAEGHQAAGHEPVPGRQGRALRRGVHPGKPARIGADLRYPGKRAQRFHRRRRQALLAASRRRRARAGARLHRQPGAARTTAGRLDHHPAAGEDAAGRQ